MTEVLNSFDIEFSEKFSYKPVAGNVKLEQESAAPLDNLASTSFTEEDVLSLLSKQAIDDGHYRPRLDFSLWIGCRVRESLT